MSLMTHYCTECKSMVMSCKHAPNFYTYAGESTDAIIGISQRALEKLQADLAESRESFRVLNLKAMEREVEWKAKLARAVEALEWIAGLRVQRDFVGRVEVTAVEKARKALAELDPSSAAEVGGGE